MSKERDEKTISITNPLSDRIQSLLDSTELTRRVFLRVAGAITAGTLLPNLKILDALASGEQDRQIPFTRIEHGLISAAKEREIIIAHSSNHLLTIEALIGKQLPKEIHDLVKQDKLGVIAAFGGELSAKEFQFNVAGIERDYYTGATIITTHTLFPPRGMAPTPPDIQPFEVVSVPPDAIGGPVEVMWKSDGSQTVLERVINRLGTFESNHSKATPDLYVAKNAVDDRDRVRKVLGEKAPLYKGGMMLAFCPGNRTDIDATFEIASIEETGNKFVAVVELREKFDFSDKLINPAVLAVVPHRGLDNLEPHFRIEEIIEGGPYPRRRIIYANY